MFYLAVYESKNFTFDGFGINKFMALTALTGALRKHGEYLRKDFPELPTFPPPGWADDIQWRELKLGHGYRDEQELLVPTDPPIVGIPSVEGIPAAPPGFGPTEASVVMAAYINLVASLHEYDNNEPQEHDWENQRNCIEAMEKVFNWLGLEKTAIIPEMEIADAAAPPVSGLTHRSLEIAKYSLHSLQENSAFSDYQVDGNFTLEEYNALLREVNRILPDQPDDPSLDIETPSGKTPREISLAEQQRRGGGIEMAEGAWEMETNLPADFTTQLSLLLLSSLRQRPELAAGDTVEDDFFEVDTSKQKYGIQVEWADDQEDGAKGHPIGSYDNPPKQIEDHVGIMDVCLKTISECSWAKDFTDLTSDGDHKDCEAFFHTPDGWIKVAVRRR